MPIVRDKVDEAILGVAVMGAIGLVLFAFVPMVGVWGVQTLGNLWDSVPSA